MRLSRQRQVQGQVLGMARETDMVLGKWSKQSRPLAKLEDNWFHGDRQGGVKGIVTIQGERSREKLTRSLLQFSCNPRPVSPCLPRSGALSYSHPMARLEYPWPDLEISSALSNMSKDFSVSLEFL